MLALVAGESAPAVRVRSLLELRRQPPAPELEELDFGGALSRLLGALLETAA